MTEMGLFVTPVFSVKHTGLGYQVQTHVILTKLSMLLKAIDMHTYTE